MKEFSVIMILFAFIVVVGCSTNQSVVNSDLKYMIDHRTKLCFAAKSLEHHSAVLTNVPCTEEVLNIIKYQGE